MAKEEKPATQSTRSLPPNRAARLKDIQGDGYTLDRIWEGIHTGRIASQKEMRRTLVYVETYKDKQGKLRNRLKKKD